MRGTEPSSGEEFQFHKGTIKTGAHRRRLRGGTDFNSIKVRLKLRRAVVLPPPLPHFNSIKVRLKLIFAACEIGGIDISIP